MFLLQLAAAGGIVAVAVGRQAMHAQMTDLGAAACIDYTREDVAVRTLALSGDPWTPSPTSSAARLAAAAFPALRPSDGTHSVNRELEAKALAGLEGSITTCRHAPTAPALPRLAGPARRAAHGPQNPFRPYSTTGITPLLHGWGSHVAPAAWLRHPCSMNLGDGAAGRVAAVTRADWRRTSISNHRLRPAPRRHVPGQRARDQRAVRDGSRNR
jgi:hypothetical protein